MVADVPLGAFLSGGVDSSTVVALMQAQSGRPIRTFTVGFEEAEFDEAGHARAVAEHLGTDHTELYLSAGEAAGVVHSLPSIYDEPFADPSQLPTCCVAQLARRSVTVSLSGDGGDELFGGYDRYQRAEQAWRRISGLPIPMRVVGARALASAPAKWAVSSVDTLRAGFLGKRPGAPIHARLRRWARALSSRRAEDLYLTMINQGGEAFLTGESPAPIGFRALALAATEDLALTERMMLMDAMSYLPDDILVKVDRASMAVSLESRIPLLDHRVVEFAWGLPLDLKVRAGQTKWVLRELLRQYVPPSLTERAKMGFGIPLGPWLRGRLRDWAEALLAEKTLGAGGILDVRQVRQAWHQHLQGRHDLEQVLWMVLMFQGWLEHVTRPLPKPPPGVGLFAEADSACTR
jgi:asparagine synthase (glutamine-hydrolysing)